MRGFTLKERKKKTQLRESFGLNPVRLETRRDIRRFKHVERKDDADWVKRCVTMEIEGTRLRGQLT